MIRALTVLWLAAAASAADIDPVLAPHFQPPAEFAGQFGPHASLLRFSDGRQVSNAADWQERRQEIRQQWTDIMGEWPPVLEKPRLEILDDQPRENFRQKRIRLQIAPDQTAEGYLLVPPGKGPFPAVFVPFYDPETCIGLNDKPYRDFALQLTRRGFVTLSIGSPGGDARLPVLSTQARCQPLSYLGYISANAWQALSHLTEVDAARIGILGHSYGGKWAMFGACLWDKYACGVWSDPGIIFDETRQSINYQEPWYLGYDPAITRPRGLVRPDSPRTGAYRTLIERGHDLIELQALMTPRPFLVSGGAEDPPKRWMPLNRLIEVNRLLGHENRIAMTNRPDHSPNEESNAIIYRFLETFLKPSR